MQGVAPALRRAGDFLAERRLRRGQARDRHPKRRAGDVVEADPIAKGDGGWVAAMLAADSELDVGPGAAAAVDPDLDQFADALLVDRDERIGGEDVPRCVGTEE